MLTSDPERPVEVSLVDYDCVELCWVPYCPLTFVRLETEEGQRTGNQVETRYSTITGKRRSNLVGRSPSVIPSVSEVPRSRRSVIDVRPYVTTTVTVVDFETLISVSRWRRPFVPFIPCVNPHPRTLTSVPLDPTVCLSQVSY